MTAVPKLATADESAPEPGWRHEDVEALTEDEVVGILLRRLRKLTARGFDPTEALIAASRIHIAIH